MSFDLRYLQKRRGVGKHFRKAIDYLIYPVAILSPFALVPQVFQLFTTQDASALSLLTWTILASMNCLWLLYGIIHHEPPIVITNVLLVLLNLAIVSGILLYR